MALQKWVTMWTRASIQPSTTDLWTAAIVILVDCGPDPSDPATRKIRPIGLAEHLTKLAESICIQVNFNGVRSCLEPSQLGAGTPDGCILLVQLLRKWVDHMADQGEVDEDSVQHLLLDDSRFEGVLPIDFKNAYGRFYRSSGLKGLKRKAPALAHLAVSLWGNRTNRVWQRCDGGWHLSETARSGFQGMLFAMVAFCFSLGNSFDALPADVSKSFIRPGYQDDTYLMGNLCEIASHWDCICGTFASDGHLINLVKSEGYLPCMDKVTTEALPTVLRNMFSSICRSIGGIKCLGSAAQGRFESFLGPYQLNVSPALKRLQAALSYGDKITRFVQKSADSYSLQIAWHHAAQSLPRALCHDARLIPPEEFKRVATPLDEKLRQVDGAICGCELDDDQWLRIRLPGPFGGCSCPAPSDSAEAAFVATCVKMKPIIRAVSQSLGRILTGCRNDDACSCAQASLQVRGVVVQGDDVCFDQASLVEYFQSPFSRDSSPQEVIGHHNWLTFPCQGMGTKLHGRIMRGLQALQAVGLHSRLPYFQREVFLSAGGLGTGKFFSIVPFRPNLFAANAHSRMIVLLRLGVVSVPDGSVCCMPKSDTKVGDFCLEPLSLPVTHPHLCKCGPARLRPHRALSTVIANDAKRAGGHVNIERACPQLYETNDSGNIVEAILDVVFHFPGGPAQRMIDITIRCPHAAQYRDCDTVAGVAAASGVKDTLDRYGPAVACVAFETYGRVAKSSTNHLRSIAFDFTKEFSRAGPGVVYNRLRWSLERALFFEIADITMLALGGKSHSGFRFASHAGHGSGQGSSKLRSSSGTGSTGTG